MQNSLYLPPQKPKFLSKRIILMMLVCVLSVSIIGFWKFSSEISPEKQLPANSMVDAGENHYADEIVADDYEDRLEALKETIDQQNNAVIRLMVNNKSDSDITLSDLGLEFVILEKESIGSKISQLIQGKVIHKLQAASGTERVDLRSFPRAELTLDKKKWNSFLSQLEDKLKIQTQEANIYWNDESGWNFQEYVAGTALNTKSANEEYARIISVLVDNNPSLHLSFQTQRVASHMSETKVEELKLLYKRLEEIVAAPIILHIGDENEELDFNSAKDFIRINETSVDINETKVNNWLSELAKKYYKHSETIRITGKEELRTGVSRAVYEGDFQEGSRISSSEIFDQIIAAIENSETEIDVRVYEIPVKVYSQLERTMYDLLSVGYSEYSHGNAENRVHNIKTGLGRLNGILIEPDQKISFNKFTGRIDSEFRMGWGIFGSSAKPVLGGGICQVSTTFYRALLNLGIPITKRQNHSWDLEYYRVGGYGLDATIYPAYDIDVKAVNDISSSLFIYSYTRPETEEAFVLIYGKSDGRKVTLTPEKEYIPFYGAKTLKWTQIIEMPDGTIRENLIKSKYRT